VLIESEVRFFSDNQLRFSLVQAITRLKRLAMDDDDYWRWQSHSLRGSGTLAHAAGAPSQASDRGHRAHD
jgi:hypothetical protein